MSLAIALLPLGGRPRRLRRRRYSGKGELILATTTSTQDSGLLDVLVPAFERDTGIKVKTVAVGSGEALALGGRARPTWCSCTRPRPRRS